MKAGEEQCFVSLFVFVFAEGNRTGHTSAMGELAQKIIRDIEAAESYEDISDWIWMAGDLIRKANSEEYHSGFEEIDRETVSWEERLQLKEATLRALERNSDPLWVVSMLSVLRDTGDRDLKKLWIESLANQLSVLKIANVNVFTVLLALSEMDEPVFEGVQSRCSMDIERNVSEANQYLKRHGILIPG
jgi:hypothetical protein